MLSNHKYERKIVHPKSYIEEHIDIHQEYDVFDGIFDDIGSLIYY